MKIKIVIVVAAAVAVAIVLAVALLCSRRVSFMGSARNSFLMLVLFIFFVQF